MNSKFLKHFTAYLLFLLIISGIKNSAAENPIQLERIVVFPNEIPQAAWQSTGNLEEIDENYIEDSSANSVEELLQFSQSVDVKTRGTHGIQSDITLRGSNFEQVLILINGISLNDPQTGHHNMDLPLSLADIGKIEIIKGPASSIYGANAMAGAINIITKKPASKKILFESSIGEHSLSHQLLSINFPFKNISNRVSFKREESSGYRPETEFENITFSFDSMVKDDNKLIEIIGGYTKKDFGADSFYSNLYSQEEEHTKTTYLSLRTQIEKENYSVGPVIYYRRHRDKYILDRTRPWWYTNYHTSYKYGFKLPISISQSWADFIMGVGGNQERITSTRLGNHARSEGSLFLQMAPHINKRTILDLGLRGDYFQNWDWQMNPYLGFAYRIKPSFKLRASVARSFRIPTFTELYYSSPANIGNENLVPEKAISYEIGCDYDRGKLKTAATLFRREVKNVIDWAREMQADAWKAQNISEQKTYGLELKTDLGLDWRSALISLSKLSFGYTYLDSDYTHQMNLSNYTANYLRHHFFTQVSLKLPFDLRQSIKLNYKKRVHQRHYFLVDSRISKKIHKEKFDIEFFISATNLLNTSYSEIGGVPMPGRWLECGARAEF